MHPWSHFSSLTTVQLCPSFIHRTTRWVCEGFFAIPVVLPMSWLACCALNQEGHGQGTRLFRCDIWGRGLLDGRWWLVLVARSYRCLQLVVIGRCCRPALFTNQSNSCSCSSAVISVGIYECPSVRTASSWLHSVTWSATPLPASSEPSV